MILKNRWRNLNRKWEIGKTNLQIGSRKQPKKSTLTMIKRMVFMKVSQKMGNLMDWEFSTIITGEFEQSGKKDNTMEKFTRNLIIGTH